MQILEILVCTLNEGIKNVPNLLLPQREDVKYLISWQQTGTVKVEVPEILMHREDVRLFHLEGRGLAANRNNALKNAVGDILLLADDDVKYTNENIDRVLHNFQKYPKADFICFRAVDREGNLLKNYSEVPYTYAKRPKSTYFSSVEIAFRRQVSVPYFDERFGLGSKYLACGEEEIFLHTAYQKGLKVIYVPEVIVETDPNTTGKRFLTFAACRRAKGAVLCELYGPASATLRSIKHVTQLPNLSAKNKVHFLKDMVAGIRYIQNGHI